MAAKNFGGGKNMTFNNYNVRTLPDGKRAFMTECAATDEGAVQMTRVKDGKNHSAGDIYFCKGGNAMAGLLKSISAVDGYQTTVGKQLKLGFASVNEASGEIERDSLQLGLVNDDGRIDRATASLLAAINKVEVGEEVMVAIHTFLHKAGDKMNDEPDSPVWSEDGYTVHLNAYQPHLATEDNPNGKIGLEAEDYYTQPSYYVKGASVIPLGRGEKPPVGIKASYDTENAAEFYSTIVQSVSASIGKDPHFANHQAPAGEAGDYEFGADDRAEEEARSRMSSRP